MVLDINLFRSPETLELVRKSHEKRGGVADDIDDLVHHDTEWKKCIQTKNGYSKLENLIKKVIGFTHKTTKKKKNDNDKSDTDSTETISDEIIDLIPDIDQPILETQSLKQLILISQMCRNKRDKIN